MHVLFVSRAKAGTGISPIVKKQGESLEGFVLLSYLAIEGQGIGGYLKGIMKIRAFARNNDIDLIHAHYSLSGITAALSFSRPVVCSLMGSDIQVKGIKRLLLLFFSRYIWKAVIVKSDRMKKNIGLKEAHVIPNGVDFNLFYPVDRNKARQKTGFDKSKKWVLFLADPARAEKNFSLVQEAFRLLGNNGYIILKAIHDIDHSLIPFYLSAADVLVVTSLWEGSPNIIKEAMACNCPIVSTDVGDVKIITSNTDGCYITSYEPRDVANKINDAILFGKRTKGRNVIAHLDSKIIAMKLLTLYKSAQ